MSMFKTAKHPGKSKLNTSQALPTLIFGADHGGYELKQVLIKYIDSKQSESADSSTSTDGSKRWNVVDAGTHDATRCDYPDVASRVCHDVVKGNASFGILVCGTGIGMSIAANKINGIRAALVHSTYDAKMAREHNNANVIVFGNRTTGTETAKEMLDAFLQASFAGEHHTQRVEKIMALETETGT